MCGGSRVKEKKEVLYEAGLFTIDSCGRQEAMRPMAEGARCGVSLCGTSSFLLSIGGFCEERLR